MQNNNDYRRTTEEQRYGHAFDTSHHHSFFKFDCLVYEMLFIRTLKPNLNVQSDSICLGFRDYAFFFFPANYALFFG